MLKMWKSRSQIFKGSWDLDCRQKPCICVATHGVVSEHQRWSTVINCQRSLKSFKVCFLVISSFSYRMQADVLQDLMEEDLPVWQWLVAALWSLWRFWIHFVRFPTAPFFGIWNWSVLPNEIAPLFHHWVCFSMFQFTFKVSNAVLLLTTGSGI